MDGVLGRVGEGNVFGLATAEGYRFLSSAGPSYEAIIVKDGDASLGAPGVFVVRVCRVDINFEWGLRSFWVIDEG